MAGEDTVMLASENRRARMQEGHLGASSCSPRRDDLPLTCLPCEPRIRGRSPPPGRRCPI
jgi:hypothetical protein